MHDSLALDTVSSSAQVLLRKCEGPGRCADLAGRLAQVDGQVAGALPEAQQRRRDAEGGAKVLQRLRPPVRQVHLRGSDTAGV